LYGGAAAEPNLPSPDEVIALFSGVVTTARVSGGSSSGGMLSTE